MWLQLVLMSIALIVCNNLSQRGDNEISRHNYVTYLIALLVFQSAMRHLAVGDDTFSYYCDWSKYGAESWKMIFYHFYETYVMGEGKDAGFFLVFKILYTFLRSFRIFLFVYAAAFFIPLSRMVEKYLCSLWQLYLFFCLYQVLFYSFFSVTGMRQGMATIATFYCVQLAKERKLVKYLVVLVLASFVHKSVLLFVPFYFLYHFKNSKILLLCALLSLPIIFANARAMATFMVDISGAEQYRMYADSEMETGGAVSFLIMILAISILTLIVKKQSPDAMPDFVVNAMAMAVIFTPLMWVDPSLMRVIQYYSIFSLIALPLAISNINISSSNRRILFWGLWAVFILTTIRHNYEYHFLWEDVPINGDSMDEIIKRIIND